MRSLIFMVLLTGCVIPLEGIGEVERRSRIDALVSAENPSSRTSWSLNDAVSTPAVSSFLPSSATFLGRDGTVFMGPTDNSNPVCNGLIRPRPIIIKDAKPSEVDDALDAYSKMRSDEGFPKISLPPPEALLKPGDAP